MRLIYWIAIFCACMLVWVSAHAAPITPRNAIPSAVDPGLLLKRLQTPPSGTASSSAPITPPAPQQQAASGPEAKIQFKLIGVTIKGNTIYSTAELETIFKPSFNKMISVATLRSLVDEVTKKYRSSGYILSRAILPPQTIKGGVVQVQVIEGYVSKVTLEGKPVPAAKIIERYSQIILNSRPLQIRELEKALLLMNDVPGVSVKAVLTPSPDIPASASLGLVTEQQRVSGYASYDNYGTRFLGPQEFSVGGTVNSLTLPGASDSVRYLTTPHSEVEYVEYNHTNTVGANGGKLTLDWNYANTRPQFTLAPFDVVGRSNMFYADIAYPLLRGRSSNFYIHSTANYESVSSTILSQPFYSDLIRSLIIGFDFQSTDSWRGTNEIKLDAEKGFAIFGAVKHVNQSRPNGVPNYFKLNPLISRIQALPWQLSLYGAMNGQYSCNTLLATEQYPYGGANWGRGYNPSEIVGDDGVGAKVELRRDSVIGKRWLNYVQYYLFYDAGIIWNRDGVNLPPKQSATSTGLGARFEFIPQITGNLFYAKPLTHSIATQLAMNKDPKKPGIFFQLTASI
jgi:hemolysin activation/secretion protein